MDSFTRITGIAMPLRRTDVDTDQIIPAQFMKRVTKSGYEDALFHSWRQEPDFVLNRPRYAAASILVAGANFGTGSSREHAVWALRDYGFRAVFSARFADIFRGNAGKQGLVAGELEQSDVERIWCILQEDPDAGATVDLREKSLVVADERFAFEIDDDTRWRLLEGLDEIETTLQHIDAIDAFEKSRARWLPRTVLHPDAAGGAED